MDSTEKKYLFVINPGSGSDNRPWQNIIHNYFTEKKITTEFLILNKPPDIPQLTKKIKESSNTVTVAVGGDGTITLVAKIVAASDGILGIIPAGSANGMARELGIPLDPVAAMDILLNGKVKKCDAIRINDKHICLHLCDIGINAQLIKYFEEGKVRGKAGYAKMIIKTLWYKKKLQVNIHSENRQIKREAFMVVLANASKYGTGAVINPTGQLDDGIFEIIIIRKLALSELLRMLFRPGLFDPRKIEILSGTSVTVNTIHSAHFQADGEYLGKIKTLQGKIMPHFVKIILP